MIRRTLSCMLFAFLLLVPALARDFYWEDPQLLGTSDSRFPLSATNGVSSVILFQDVERINADRGRMWLSLRVYSGGEWIVRNRFAGPFAYEGEVPSIASITIDSRNAILVSAMTAVNTISVFVSRDLGASFTESHLNGNTSAVLAPCIFVRSDGGYLLFATRGGEDNFSLVYSRSDDGMSWSPYQIFGPSENKKRPFLPSHVVSGSSDIIVFQAFHEGETRSSYQLYSTRSSDRGNTWTNAEIITGFAESGAEAGSAAARFENYHNQRSRLMKTGGVISLVWERARTSSEKYSIYYATLGSQGQLSSQPERISSTDGYCYNPDIAELDGSPAVVWFDNRKGVNRIYMARKEGYLWSETDISRNSLDSVFGKIVSVGDNIEVYWQQSQGRAAQRVVRLAPDRSVRKASIVAENFKAGRKGRIDVLRASVAVPDDSSGVAGFSWAWGPLDKPEVPATILQLPEDNRLKVESNADGSWFLGVRVADYAGNWSEPSYIEYIRDTTPPAAPMIATPSLDEAGYLSSNSFSLSWSPSDDETIAGYSWSFDYLAPVSYLSVLARLAPGSQATAVSADSRTVTAPAMFDFASAAASKFAVSPPPSSIRGSSTSVSFTNRDNGIYALSVAAVDEVGNIGKPAVTYVVLNKYIPFTWITYVDSKVDETGTINLSIVGRGFTEGGAITEVYLDRDGKAPWDRSLSRSGGQFSVKGDRLISGISLSDVEEGSYRIALIHPVRGTYLSKPLLTVSAFGTVKFGDYRFEFTPPWKEALPEPAFALRPDSVLLYSVLAFAVMLFLFSVRGIAGTAREAISVRGEVRALITGDIMPSEKKKRSVTLRNRGVGLRFKLSFFTTALVISVVLIVSIPLGMQFSANQEKTLAQGLQSRVEVLLESLASGARAYLPSQNILELGFLPEQMAALSEARSATITGNGLDGSSTGIDYVWATNDGSIAEKISTQSLVYGKSQLVTDENAEIAKRATVLDEEAFKAVGELSEGIASLTLEGRELALKTDEESVTRRDEIQTITRQLEEKMNVELTRLSTSGMGSWPEYDPLSLSRDITRYVFYKPVLYRQGTDTKFVHGTVRLEISTESLLETVTQDRLVLIRTTVFVAVIAVLIGALASLVLASIIISPVRKLASHVAMIRDTEDKETLDGKYIKLRSRDEIGLLGETINDMTHGLVKAAAASKDLTVGKDVQKMFIPLEIDSRGHKITYGKSTDDNAEFFGYYEGAKGVSGDYFDYKKLDDRHYAIIKCDVAGKGVPAALIMVEVATLFLNYFKDWTYKKNGYKLDGIVSRINDLIESLGLKGRFAAFTLCIFDSVSGDVYFCNAGDNIVHIFDSGSKSLKTLKFPETPAAGVFPTDLVDMKGGFPVVKQHLNPGDVLFLYTDGIEEAKRLFRTKDLVVHMCAEPGLEKEAIHGTHTVGKDNEEMGPERVTEIVEAVFSRRPYSLYKWHNPEENEPLEFDFTTCEGTFEEAILALVSVEKIFRMYRDPKATEFDRVQVDRKVDQFLNGHFKQYPVYCGNRKDLPEYGEYLYYTNIREDAQYDDLTILGIRKKTGGR